MKIKPFECDFFSLSPNGNIQLSFGKQQKKKSWFHLGNHLFSQRVPGALNFNKNQDESWTESGLSLQNTSTSAYFEEIAFNQNHPVQLQTEVVRLKPEKPSSSFRSLMRDQGPAAAWCSPHPELQLPVPGSCTQPGRAVCLHICFPCLSLSPSKPQYQNKPLCAERRAGTEPLMGVCSGIRTAEPRAGCPHSGSSRLRCGRLREGSGTAFIMQITRVNGQSPWGALE